MSSCGRYESTSRSVLRTFTASSCLIQGSLYPTARISRDALVVSCYKVVSVCLVLSCLVLSCLVLSCLVLSCLVLSCLSVLSVLSVCLSITCSVAICLPTCLSFCIQSNSCLTGPQQSKEPECTVAHMHR